MTQPEQDAMQIIKTLLRPLIPTLVELIKEYEQASIKNETEKSSSHMDIAQDSQRQHTSHESIDFEYNPPQATEIIATKQDDEEQEVYILYQALPEQLKSSMSGFIDGATLESFLQPLWSVEQFWEFCKTEVQRSDGIANSEALNQLFTFFFKRQMPEGYLYEAETGDRFSPATMIHSNTGKRTGIVKQTVLVGFGLADETGEMLKNKAVVLLV